MDSWQEAVYTSKQVFQPLLFQALVLFEVWSIFSTTQAQNIKSPYKGGTKRTLPKGEEFLDP